MGLNAVFWRAIRHECLGKVRQVVIPEGHLEVSRVKVESRVVILLCALEFSLIRLQLLDEARVGVDEPALGAYERHRCIQG